MKKLLIICGPTATGKTGLATLFAKKYNGELVSADSRQVYRGMDIATGKDKETIGTVPVWLYDVVNPDEPFSVAQYRTLALDVIEQLHKKGILPVVVGGTGLYIKALLEPIETAFIPPDDNLRLELNAMTIEQLQKLVEKEDARTWDKLNHSDRANPRRLIRKIEIARSKASTDKPQRGTPFPASMFDPFIVCLTAPLPELYRRIDERVDARVREGIESEIRHLLSQGYSWDLPSMNTFGYKEWKNVSREKAIETWKFDEHGYARRQLTWFKKQEGFHWYDVTEGLWREKVEADVSSWYTQSIR